MRVARVFFKDQEAGELIQDDKGQFTFRYHDSWLSDSSKPAISLTLPKQSEVFHSESLFPFFFNSLPEGANKEMACKKHRIEPDDHFGLLLSTAGYDTIGAVTVKEKASDGDS